MQLPWLPRSPMAAPLTTLTDYAIALETLLFAVWLWPWGREERCWAGVFISISLAALAGGTYHGWGGDLSANGQAYLWQGVVVGLAGASFWALVAVASDLRPPWQFGLLALAAVKLGLALGVGNTPMGFALRVGDYLSALIIVLLLYGWRARQGSSPGLIWMGAALAISLLAAILLALPAPATGRISPAAVYHLVQMVGLYCLYHGVWSKARGRRPLQE